nr:phospho-sugar mutase [Actinomycetota bacterium]
AWLAAHREPTAYREPTEAAEHPERSEPAGADSVVVVGYDARHGSRDFAHESAAILAAAGFAARLLPAALPTPVLAFAVQRLGAAAGVMVTASHNPREDNGYKVYGGDGAQIVPPADQEIEAAIRAVGPTGAIPRSENFERLDESIVADYVDAVARLVGPPAAPITVVHTALHGVGTGVVRRVFEQAGYGPLLSVAAQAEPDPDFPTVAFPNPEEPGAIDLALQRARAAQADLVVANDPDADRCAVAVQFAGVGWRMLTGDELGVLLADALLAKGVRGTYATTIVSSSMLQAMAAAHGVGFAETLTGFKWIVRAAVDVVYGYEEALGYAVNLDAVRDKDGISAAILATELAAKLRAAGSSIPQRLDELAASYGRHVTDQIAVRVEDRQVIAETMQQLRERPPPELLGRAVTVTDLLPEADALVLRAGHARVVVRPSGTEAKLKAYLEVVVDGAQTDLSEAARLRDEVSALLGIG